MKRELSLARVLVVVSMLLALGVGINRATTGMAALPGSTFNAGDGNLVITGSETDWITFPDGTTRKADQPSGQNDDSFGQGTAENDAVPSVVSGQIPPNKSDLTNFYVASQDTVSTTFMYLAWSRVQEPSGTTNMDFELNQSSTLSANGVTPERTVGDILIKYDLANGGTNPVLGWHRWITTSNPGADCEAGNRSPCWDKVHAIVGSAFEASINSAPVDNLLGGTYSARTFGEAAIDMVGAGIFQPGQCVSFGSAYLKSRSSDSFTAAIKDFVAPKNISVANCGTIKIHKTTVPAGGTGFNFTTTGGLTPSTFSLDDAGTRTYNNVLAGQYSVTEGLKAGYDLTNLVCTANGGTSTFTINIANRSATINLAPEDTVDCTFTNTGRGTIIIKKVTDPAGSATSFPFTASGGLTPTTFSLTHNQTFTYTGILPGSSYAVTETAQTGWDLISATCNDGSPVSGIDVSAGETVTCTFTNRQRGTVNVHKADDTAANLQGAIFTLYNDAAPVGGTRGNEDTSTGLTCQTDATGNCSLANLLPGNYWLVETTTPSGYTSVADQSITVGAGGTVSLNLTDPREFKVIVLVCRESDNTLYPSTVTVDGVNKTSLQPGGGGAITDASLCGLGGANYDNKATGNHPANVNIGATPVP
jgi:hypothetical protein